MVWNEPYNWAAGVAPSATDLDEGVRDPLRAVGYAWTAYTPTWTGATTNPVLNNGTLTAKNRDCGKTIDFSIHILMGSTTTYGSGAWSLTLPITPEAIRWYFVGVAYDSSAGLNYKVSATRSAGSTLLIQCDPLTAGNDQRNVTSANPFTWATGDTLTITGTYEQG